MDFRNWLMREMGHMVMANKDMRTRSGREILMIDPRTEFYPHGIHAITQAYSFYGELPDNEGFVVNIVDPEHGAEGHIVFQRPAGIPKLPPDWWDYASVVYADGEIKEPTK